MEERKKFVLCEARHDMPFDMPAVFPQVVVDVTDIPGLYAQVKAAFADVDHKIGVDVYVTGLTVCLCEVIRYCMDHAMPLVLWHYDRNSGAYYHQVMISHDAAWRERMLRLGYT